MMTVQLMYVTLMDRKSAGKLRDNLGFIRIRSCIQSGRLGGWDMLFERMAIFCWIKKSVKIVE